MESNVFFKCSLNHVENAVWKKIYNLGFEGKFHFETNILESLKVHFVYGQFLPSPSHAPHPQSLQKHFFWNNTACVVYTQSEGCVFSSWWMSGSSRCYFLPVKNNLGEVSPNREVNRAQWSHGLETFILLKPFNQKHKGEVLDEKNAERNRS